ncbi:MAG TPA: ribosome assembly RNA-binding protein YhbY, partial [Ruminococcaceae bacterium]|nr:ribosome assembly RNA-binding protein YhbY [Oscillospiraceae bacterium]
QRAYLRSLANGLETILTVGKSGLNPEIVRQANDALKARELIKGRVLETSPVTSSEASERISTETSAETVQVIGSKFILYRENEKNPKIILPKRRKK